MLKSVRLLMLSVALLAAPAAHASDYITLYAGLFDISQEDNSATQFGAEYRYADIFHGLRPGVGFNASTDESFYGYGGFFWDIPVYGGLVFTPNVVVGGYSQGDGKDLGNAIEFRSGVELTYEFPYRTRLGLAFNHISNASIGNDNPGAETLMLIYHHPLDWWDDRPREKRWWHNPQE